MKKAFVLVCALACFFILAGCVQPQPGSETACENDSDCACGVHVQTGDCFAGNKAFVDTTRQCPDFCTGIAGNFVAKCVQGTCKNVQE